MSLFEITVSQHNVRREGGQVRGTLQINVKDPDFQHNQDFDYPTDGQVRLLDQDIPIGHILVVIAEGPHGQSCVTGYVEISVAGFKTKKDFDKNCEAIREG